MRLGKAMVAPRRILSGKPCLSARVAIQEQLELPTRQERARDKIDFLGLPFFDEMTDEERFDQVEALAGWRFAVRVVGYCPMEELGWEEVGLTEPDDYWPELDDDSERDYEDWMADAPDDFMPFCFYGA